MQIELNSDESINKLVAEVEKYSKRSKFQPEVLKRFDELFQTDLGFHEIDDDTESLFCNSEPASGKTPFSKRKCRIAKTKLSHSSGGMDISHIDETAQSQLSQMEEIATPKLNHNRQSMSSDEMTTPSFCPNYNPTSFTALEARNTKFVPKVTQHINVDMVEETKEQQSNNVNQIIKPTKLLLSSTLKSNRKIGQNKVFDQTHKNTQTLKSSFCPGDKELIEKTKRKNASSRNNSRIKTKKTNQPSLPTYVFNGGDTRQTMASTNIRQSTSTQVTRGELHSLTSRKSLGGKWANSQKKNHEKHRNARRKRKADRSSYTRKSSFFYREDVQNTLALASCSLVFIWLHPIANYFFNF